MPLSSSSLSNNLFDLGSFLRNSPPTVQQEVFASGFSDINTDPSHRTRKCVSVEHVSRNGGHNGKRSGKINRAPKSRVQLENKAASRFSCHFHYSCLVRGFDIAYSIILLGERRLSLLISVSGAKALFFWALPLKIPFTVCQCQSGALPAESSATARLHEENDDSFILLSFPPTPRPTSSLFPRRSLPFCSARGRYTQDHPRFSTFITSPAFLSLF